MIPLPLQLPYPGASTVAECPDAETAAALIAVVNAAWLLAVAEGGSVLAWRRALERLLEAVQGVTK